MDISRHPLLKQCSDLALAIEACGASKQLTDLQCMCQNLKYSINDFLDALDAQALEDDRSRDMHQGL